MYSEPIKSFHCITKYNSNCYTNIPERQRTIRKVLEREIDFEIVGDARNGQEAIRMNNDLNPDILTMDINMPNMNGIKATREIIKTNPKPNFYQVLFY